MFVLLLAALGLGIFAILMTVIFVAIGGIAPATRSTVHGSLLR